MGSPKPPIRQSSTPRSKQRCLSNRGRYISPLLIPLCVVAGLISVGGCQTITETVQYNDIVDDFVIGWRNQVWAAQAWHREKSKFHDHPQLHAFGEGFRAGYKNVASGGDGCPPALPPNKYWNWRYQSFEGQAKVAAWFEGFPYGAAAAESDNAAAGREIQVSDPIRIQYSHEFQNVPVPPEFLPPERQDPRAGHRGNTSSEELPLGTPGNYRGSSYSPQQGNEVRPLRPGPIEQSYRSSHPPRYRGGVPDITPKPASDHRQVSYLSPSSNRKRPGTVDHAIATAAGTSQHLERLPRVMDQMQQVPTSNVPSIAQWPTRISNQFGAAE